ncbi:hypothetical protein JAAARDRAFT_36939 [Jaapia argillacea MUCL 33604]|uniref:F-box domain-containing protein n=1 Tax=Jaapia argillacea MUCL 33604 TaxID=933084 RepID=A0A067Q0L0_9AGAM|nr:hypothetical protein JAAARDRAFT_36939 [Jaapia argillacea MUCL 33604]
MEPISRLESLPTELTITILNDLNLYTLLGCRRLSSHIKSIIDDTPILQYKIELGITGMTDGPNTTMTIEERRTRLKNYQDAWANVESKAMEASPTPMTGQRWKLVGGVLALSRGPRS